MQRLCVLNDKISSMFVIDSLTEAGFYLLRDIEIIKNRNLSRVELDDILLLGRDKGDVVFDFFENILVVDIDILKGFIEKVAQHGDSPACLFKHELRPLLRLLYLH